MAILNTAVEITINTDNSFTIIIDCDYVKDSNHDDNSMKKEDLTFSAKTVEEVNSILSEYLPKLHHCSDRDIMRNTFDFYSKKNKFAN